MKMPRSGIVVSIGLYDFEIEFKDGSKRIYYNVPEEMVERLEIGEIMILTDEDEESSFEVG